MAKQQDAFFTNKGYNVTHVMIVFENSTMATRLVDVIQNILGVNGKMSESVCRIPLADQIVPFVAITLDLYVNADVYYNNAAWREVVDMIRSYCKLMRTTLDCSIVINGVYQVDIK